VLEEREQDLVRRYYGLHGSAPETQRALATRFRMNGRQVRDMLASSMSRLLRARIRDLSGGQRQGVAIARAIHWAMALILMDEPTAALGVAETARVEQLMLQLRGRGRATLLVSHNLDQVFRVADRIAVLRRGVHIGVRDTRQTSHNEIVSMITGLQAPDAT